MKIPNDFYRWVAGQNSNLPLIGLITFFFPKIFMQSIYNCNKNKKLWGERKACLTISFDCDYPEDVIALPKIAEMMKPYPFKASFAAVGHWIEDYPREHEAVLRAGHEILNHTYSHPDNELLNPGRKFVSISREEKLEEVVRCHEICESVLGYSPIGFRIPHFKNLFTPDIYQILKDIGYKYSSSTWLTNTCSHGLPFKGDCGIIEFPLSTCPSHPFTVFDTWHSLNAKRWSHRIKHRGAKQYLDLFKLLIRYAKETESYINIYLDPLDMEKIPKFYEILDLISNDGDIIVMTYQEYLESGMYIHSNDEDDRRL